MANCSVCIYKYIRLLESIGFLGPEVVIFALKIHMLIGIWPCGLVIHASKITRQFLFSLIYCVSLKKGPARAARGTF